MPSSQRVPTSSDSSSVSLLLKQHTHDRMWFALLSLCDELLSEMTPKKKQKTLFWVVPGRQTFCMLTLSEVHQMQNGCVIIILTNLSKQTHIWGKDMCKLSLCEYFSGPECQMGREACRKSKATLWSRLGLLGRDFRSPRRCRCSTPWSEHSSENKVRSEYGMENKVWSEYSSENKVRYEYSMENKVRSKYGSENKYVVMTCSLLLLTTPPFLTTKV